MSNLLARFYAWLLPIRKIGWIGGPRVTVPYLVAEPMHWMAEKDDTAPIAPLFSFETMTKEVFDYKCENGLLDG